MEYAREVWIPFHAAEFQVSIMIDGVSYEGLLHVSRSGKALHPIEIVYLPDGIELPIKPHQERDCSWDTKFGNPAYVKRMTFKDYGESETVDERADDFSKAVEKKSGGRIKLE